MGQGCVARTTPCMCVCTRKHRYTHAHVPTRPPRHPPPPLPGRCRVLPPAAGGARGVRAAALCGAADWAAVREHTGGATVLARPQRGSVQRSSVRACVCVEAFLLLKSGWNASALTHARTHTRPRRRARTHSPPFSHPAGGQAAAVPTRTRLHYSLPPAGGQAAAVPVRPARAAGVGAGAAADAEQRGAGRRGRRVHGGHGGGAGL